MRRTALLALLLLCACTDAPPLTPAWGEPARALMASATPLPGNAADAARATLAAVSAAERGATARASASDTAYSRALQGTYEALALMRAQDAATATRVALEAAYAGTARAGADAGMAAADARRASATAGVLAATDTAQARMDAQTLAGYERTATGGRELGVMVGVIALCAGLPVLALTAAFAWLYVWRRRADMIELANGEALRHHGGRWEYVPAQEVTVDVPEVPADLPVPDAARGWMQERVGGRLVALHAPVGKPATDEDRALTLELLDAVRQYVAEHPEWPASQLPGWRRLAGDWQPEPWVYVRALLGPYITGAKGKVKTLRPPWTWDDLRQHIAAGGHLSTAALPQTSVGKAAERSARNNR